VALHQAEHSSDPDALVALCIDTIKLAIFDVLRGPHGSAKQQLQYHSALKFLERVGLLQLVIEHYRLVHGTDEECLVDELD
jgi:hypothetical protein